MKWSTTQQSKQNKTKQNYALPTHTIIRIRISKNIFKSKNILVAQMCLTLCDPMDCSLPCSSVLGIP